jgi:hypothetical protein
MKAPSSFFIHADVDGYLDDPVLGPINEKIYNTIIKISVPNIASNRPYPLRQPPLAIFMEAYSLMNDFAEEPHPEENCVQYHFHKVREHVIDTYAAEVVISVVFVLLRLQRTKKSQRLISVIKSSIDANSGYFKAFEEVANDLEKLGYYVNDSSSPHSADDWQAKYLILQEQYLSLLSVYQSAAEGTQLEVFPEIPPVSKEAGKNGIVLITDLLDAVVETNTADVFDLLDYYTAKTSGNMRDLIKIREKLFRASAINQYDSNLAFNEKYEKIDLIRVFLAIFHLLVQPRVGKKLTVKEYFDIIGKVFNYDFGNVTKYYSESLASGCSADTIKAIFELLGQNLVNVYDRLKAKK